MAQKYFAYLTTRGEAKLAQATALGIQLKLTQMGVGDGGGTLPTPLPSQTSLINEKRRAGLNSLTVDPQNPAQLVAEQIIPENEGGWWIREIGLYDDANELIAVANCAETYKPLLAEGSGRTQAIRMVLIVSSTDAVTLKIDPAVILATRKYVEDTAIVVKAYADDVMKKHVTNANPHPQYAPLDSPKFYGIPAAPTAPEGEFSQQIANTAFVQIALSLLTGSAPTWLDTLGKLAAAIDSDPNFAKNNSAQLALKAPLLSPALSGQPTTPTPAAGNNSQQIANTAFVQSAIAKLVASSPEALDTLGELAAALGNDPNFATTVLNALAGKQPLDNTLTALAGKNVAGLLQYLGLGEAAKRGVGTGQNQLPDMSSFTFTGTLAGWVAKGPGKLIVQGGITGSIVSAPWDVGFAFPTPFPSQVLAIFPFNLIPAGGRECVLWAFNNPNLQGGNVRAIGIASQIITTVEAPYSGLNCGWMAIGV